MTKAENYLDLNLVKFVHVLRHLGLRVSAAEVIDAMRALTSVDLLSRSQVQGTLAATLVKNRDDQALFNQAFNSYFSTPEARQQRLEQRQIRMAEEAEQLAEAEEELVFAGEEGMEQDGWVPDKLDLSREDLQTYNRMPETAKGKLRDYLKSHMEGNDINDPRRLLSNVIQSQLAYWKRKLAQEEEEDSGNLDLALMGEEELDEVLEHVKSNLPQQHSIMHTDMKRIAPEDVAKAEVLIKKMARRLATRISRRYRQSLKKQAVDIRRTVRYNLRYGGTPLALRYRSQRIDRPQLLLLCDVSGSMARYATFVLQFIYGLSSAVGRIESFIFAEDLEQVTERFGGSTDFQDTMVGIMNQSSQWGRGTDLAKTLDSLMQQYSKKLASDTIVILLSDGRTVAPDQAAQRLSKIAAKCKQILWLNTLPATEWKHIKALQVLAGHARLFECYTLAHLDKILRSHML